MKTFLTTIIAASISVACVDESSRLRDQLHAVLTAQKLAVIDLGTVGPPSWERICVLAPYTDNSRAEKILGFKWDAERQTSISGNDSVTVLVFVRQQSVVAFTEYPRNDGDFANLQPHCLERANAKIVPVPGSNGFTIAK